MTETQIKAKVFIINPMLGDIKEKDIIADSHMPVVQTILGMIKDGEVDVFTMETGDRLCVGKGAMDPTSDKFKLGSAALGTFAFLRKAPTIDEMAGFLVSGINPDKVDMFEVAGPAMIVGPAVSDDDKSATGSTLSFLDAAMRVGLKGPSLASVLRELGGSRADNDNASGGYSDSVYDSDLVALRHTLTDEELAQCPCPGCKDEMARRAVEAGGSKAVN